jgi:RNA polymerase sigma factor (sigma-70 family)
MAGSDLELVARAKAGDRGAIAALFEQHGPTARQAVAGHIPRRWQSVLSEDDVMQQTYMDAALSIKKFEPRGDGSMGAWMARLATCNLQDALKALKAVKRGGDRRRVEHGPGSSSALALHELLATTSSTPSRHAARDEAGQTLKRAVNRLPRGYRRVIQLYDLESKPIEQVAAELDRSQGAVYMLRARAHDRLREILGSPSRFFTDAP